MLAMDGYREEYRARRAQEARLGCRKETLATESQGFATGAFLRFPECGYSLGCSDVAKTFNQASSAGWFTRARRPGGQHPQLAICKLIVPCRMRSAATTWMLAVILACCSAFGGDTNAPAVATDEGQEILVLADHLREQHMATMWFLDQLRQDLEERSKRNGETVSAVLNRTHQLLAAQTRWEAESEDAARQFMVNVAAVAAAASLAVFLVTCAFMVWTVNRRLEWLRRVLLPHLPLRVGVSAGSISEIAEHGLTSEGPVGPRLLAALEQLEKRIGAMERQAHSLPTGAHGQRARLTKPARSVGATPHAWVPAGS